MKTCAKCGSSPVIVGKNKCKVCLAVYNTAWRRANPNKVKAYKAKWRESNREASYALSSAWKRANKVRANTCARAIYAANPERARDKTARWRNANPEKVRASIGAWQKANPGKANANTAKRNARKLQATPSWADFNAIKDVYLEAEYMQMHVDHIVPLQSKLVCGLHVWDNLQLLTKTKNGAKGNRHWPDMPDIAT